MSPEYNPQATLDDAIAQAKERGTTAVTWAFLILAGLGLVAMGARKLR